MLVSPTLAAGVLVLSLAAMSSPAHADDRTLLNACQALIDRAAQDARPASIRQDDAELQRCRQVIREWTLRDARRSVDEQGRPLR